jgi:hypothetical protein
MSEIQWAEMQPGWSWRSADGTYVILRSVLPEDRPQPAEVFTLRKIDHASARAWPGRLGYFRAERYTLAAAQAEARRDAYCDEHRAERSVPEDFPSVALEPAEG